MSIKVFSIDDDKVINSKFINASTTFGFSLEKISPLINRLEIQRRIQKAKFYERLERDLVTGCIMPPLTLAFVQPESSLGTNLKEIESFVNQNIQSAFVLDGIQRLNTLTRTYKNHPELDLTRPLFLNIIVCDSMDKLLYRMITLNNGQKPMSPAHQIEILANNLYDFQDSQLRIVSDKDKQKKRIIGSFNKADFIKAYLGFLSGSTNIDNQKIIEDKMDEIIAEKIITSDLDISNIEFSQVLDLIENLTINPVLHKWLKNANNLIGFSVGIKKSFYTIQNLEPEEFESYIKKYEYAMSQFNPSKIKLGTFRRKTSHYFIENIESLSDEDLNEIVLKFSEF